MNETDRERTEKVAVKEQEDREERQQTDDVDVEAIEEQVADAEADHEELEAEAEEISEEQDDLAAQLEEALEKADEYLDQWRRTAAEFANFRKRKEREREELERRANERLLLKLLPIYDDFTRALENVPEHLEDEDWVGGIQMIERKFWAVLEQEGVAEIESVPGMEFNPELHDALMSVESDEYESGEIVDVFEPGYKHNGRVLRAAKVRVAQ